ncbi:MAG: UDP-3-O-(3-hydroxymyristoyl)glucosamine N-acyltransferase [Candidatus Tantalella remota]|nr:UDP-3-O-(3-hydroxymyristoyl)glucosamine N-acyltransferase [Candidatus Tantalella remota]
MFTVDQIAGLVKGEVIGDGKVSIKGMAACTRAEEGDITFATDAASMEYAGKSQASCVLTEADIEGFSKTLLKVKNLKEAVTVLYNAMLEVQQAPEGNIHPEAIVDVSVGLGENVVIGPGTTVGAGTVIGKNTQIGANCAIGSNVVIGEGSRIYATVTVYDGMQIGNKVMIHSGTVIGADGFGYVPAGDKIYKVPQMGRVVIKDNVEIGANSCVDRGTFADTVIGENTKMDNFVQIAHNVKIGKNNLLASQTGVAGSTSTGENVMMGGQVGIADHCKIGNNVKLAANTGISGNIADGEVRLRYPARSPLETKKLDRLMILMLRNAEKFGKFLKDLSK